jgi:hypothetical protein
MFFKILKNNTSGANSDNRHYYQNPNSYNNSASQILQHNHTSQSLHHIKQSRSTVAVVVWVVGVGANTRVVELIPL